MFNDITYCKGKDCSMKYICRRFLEKDMFPKDELISVFTDSPIQPSLHGIMICDYFLTK